MLTVTVGGARGTAPVAGEGFLEFGGETTSLLVEGTAGDRVIIDAGTGLRRVAERLGSGGGPRSLLLLLTHYHMDHIVGLPTFPLLYDAGWRVEIAAPRREGRTASEALSVLFGPPFWPVSLADVPAEVSFTTLPDEGAGYPYRWGDLEIRWCPVPHPQACTAYRVDERGGGGGSVLCATDVEWREASGPQRAEFLRLCTAPRPADILLFDGNYGEEDYAGFRGWGHSTREEAVSVAREAGAGRLFITHHDPDATDERLARIERALAARLPGVCLARAGMRIPSPRNDS